MNWWMEKWNHFEKKHPKLSKWVYQIAFFFVFSMGVTIVQYLFFTFMPGILGEKTGGNRIYVATGADEDCRSGIYMELIGV